MSSAYTVKWYPNEDEPKGAAKEFIDGLTGQCLNKYKKLREYLKNMGPNLRHTPMLRHIKEDVLELRELCDGGALRIYLFRDGTTFYLVNGEVKAGKNEADPDLVDKAQQCCNKHGEARHETRRTGSNRKRNN